MSSPVATSVIEGYLKGNAWFANTSFVAGLSMLPNRKTIVVGCVDPRVDPAAVLGVDLGDALIVRNIGGRFTPNTLRTLALLAAISRSKGGQPGPGWNLVVLQHTDCGIALLDENHDALAAELGLAASTLTPDTLGNPRAALHADLKAVGENPFLPRGLAVTGLLYDTTTGLIETVVPTFVLRDAQP
jgi:carbonic anhydrase